VCVGDRKTAVVTSSQISRVNVSAPVYLRLVSKDSVTLSSTRLTSCNGLLVGYVYIPKIKFRYKLQGHDINGNVFSVIKPSFHHPLPPPITPNHPTIIPPTLSCKCYNGGTCETRIIRRRKLTICLCPPSYRGSLCQDGKICFSCTVF